MSKCECSDPGCPVHNGRSSCNKVAKQCLVRVDMEDKTGTLFCFDCAEDAMESGVFGGHSVGHWIEATKKIRRVHNAKRKTTPT